MSNSVVLQLLVFYGGLSIFLFGALGYALLVYRRHRKNTADAANLKRISVSLDEASIEALRNLGDGELSLGIRRAAAISKPSNE